MLVRPATMADVRHIGRTLWERGVKELDALGIGPEKWLQGWLERIQRGDAVAFGDHAILGCNKHAGFGVITTSFQASKSFEEPGVGLKVTKEIRRAIPSLMKERRANVSFTYSLCVDPSAEKWFRLLGLEEDKTFTPVDYGPYTMRRFWRAA